MREVQLLPTLWIAASGLVFWVPGEIARRVLQRDDNSATKPQGKKIPITALFFVTCACMQAMAGDYNAGTGLTLLAASILISNASLYWLSNQNSRIGAISRTHFQVSQQCLDASLYTALIFLAWWAPSGISSIWEWPLQFEPSAVAIAACTTAAIANFIGWQNRNNPKLLKLFAFTSCCFWQMGGAISKSLTISQILNSEKVTGYFSASKGFASVDEISREFVISLGTLPFHVNTHPAGKVVFFQLLNQSGTEDPSQIWSTFILLMTALCPLLTHKACRVLGLSLERSALAALATATLPSFAMFSPGFDIFNATLSTLLLVCWIKSITSKQLPNKSKWSIGTGLIGLTCLVNAYNLLTFGSVLIGYAFFIVFILKRSTLLDALLTSLLAAIAMVSSIFILEYLTGYSPMDSLMKSMAIQSSIEASNRAGAVASFLNSYDFLLGVGPFLFLMLLSTSLPELKERNRNSSPSNIISCKDCLQSPDLINRNGWKLGLITMISIAAISLSGTLDIETARVWIFLMPTVTIAIAFNSRLTTSVLYPQILLTQSLWGIMMISRYQFFF